MDGHYLVMGIMASFGMSFICGSLMNTLQDWTANAVLQNMGLQAFTTLFSRVTLRIAKRASTEGSY